MEDEIFLLYFFFGRQTNLRFPDRKDDDTRPEGQEGEKGRRSVENEYAWHFFGTF